MNPIYKICTIHNILDFEKCLSSEVTHIGIHLTNTSQYTNEFQIKYRSPLAKEWIYHTLSFVKKDFPICIPIFEYVSIKLLIKRAEKNKNIKITFLLNQDALTFLKEILQCFQISNIINIAIQVQSDYSKEHINHIVSTFHNLHLNPPEIIQTVVYSKINKNLFSLISQDKKVNYVLIDNTSMDGIMGGTGKPFELSEKLNFGTFLSKPIILAGGLNISNIIQRGEYFKKSGYQIAGFDVESYLETNKQVKFLDDEYCIIERKDRSKIEALNTVIQEFKLC